MHPPYAVMNTAYKLISLYVTFCLFLTFMGGSGLSSPPPILILRPKAECGGCCERGILLPCPTVLTYGAAWLDGVFHCGNADGAVPVFG